jgi:putative membrane protein
MLSIRRLSIIFLFAGLFVAIWLFDSIDVTGVVRAVSVIGWSFLLVLAVRIMLLYVDAHSWRWLLLKEVRPSLNLSAFQRWIGEGVAILLPFATISGELARVRLAMVYGMRGSVAFASIIMDAVVAVVSQILFLTIGLTLYIATGRDHGAVSGSAGLGLIALMLATGAMVAAVQGGWLGTFGRFLKGLFAGPQASWVAEAMTTVDEQISKIVSRRAEFLRSVLWRLLGWLLGAAEIALILYLLGEPVSVGEALMIDALTTAVRTAFFFVPAGLGVQEGSLMFLGATLGIDGEVMMAAALIKRARELAFSFPALLAWQWVEGNSAVKESEAS